MLYLKQSVYCNERNDSIILLHVIDHLIAENNVSGKQRILKFTSEVCSKKQMEAM
jgi:hypothetical protein